MIQRRVGIPRVVDRPGRGGRRARGLGLASLLGGWLLLGGPALAVDYPLRPGDILSVTIIGVPELARAVPVEADGTAWFPAIGPVQAVGKPLAAIRAAVTEAYVGMVAAEAEVGAPPRFIAASQVYVGVSEYRPIYVSGDMIAATTVAFRPGLTARRALALAGAGPARAPDQAGMAEQFRAAVVDLSRVQARIWSLKRQLGTDLPADYRNILVDGSEAVREIAEAARAMVAAQTREREREKTRIDEAIARANGRLAALVGQKASEEEGRQLDDQTVAEVRELFERGSPLAPATRLADVRRSALASASRVLELEVAAENTRTTLADLSAQATDISAGARSETWAALADALAEAQGKQARLAALRSTPVGVVGDDFVVAILRDGTEVGPEGGADPELFPGDAIEVRRIDQDPAGATAPLGQ